MNRRSSRQNVKIPVLLFVASLVVITAIPAFASGSGVFNTTGSMNVARADHTATLLSNGQVLVTGGFNASDGYLASAEIYDPSKGKWTLTSSMTAPRDGHDAVLLQNGKVLVAGGINTTTSGCTTLASAELYDPSTGTWTPTASMTTGRYDFALVALPDGEVLAAGGTNCGNGGLTSAERYNPSTQTWTATGSMTLGNETNWAVGLQNGEVFIVWDYNLYNPSLGTWSAAAQHPIAVGFPVLLPSGKVFAAGGIQGNSIYDPSLNQWTTFPPPPCTTTHQSCEAAGALLRTGEVLVAGGPTFVNARPYPIEETNGLAALLDPSTLIWASTGSMNKSRLGETMTVLLHGQVLAAGGETYDRGVGHLVYIASAELYTP